MAEPPAVNEIVRGDSLQVLPTWPAGCVDLVFADPPFNIGYQYDRCEDNRPYEDYVLWTEEWIYQCQRVLKPDGTFWIAIGDEFAAEIRMLVRENRWGHLRNWIIWYYTFGQNCKYKFNRSHTHLFYFVKDADCFTFNTDAVRVESARQTTYNDKRANPKGKLADDVWTQFPRVCGTFKERVGWHPCQMPLGLLRRIVVGCSNPDDIVLDPFAGSGTTLLSAAQNGRRWVGIELSREYVKEATRRIETECSPV